MLILPVAGFRGSPAGCSAMTPGSRPGQVADELARRRKPSRSKVQSYSEAELEKVRKAARRTFRSALQRIGDNALHLQRWREGAFAEGTGDWALGEATGRPGPHR